REPAPVATVLVPLLAPGVLYQDAANGLRRGSEEMAAMVPIFAVLCPNQPEICLVNEGRRLQGVARGLSGQLGGGHAAQLVIYEREQIGSSLAVPCRRDVQEQCHIGH